MQITNTALRFCAALAILTSASLSHAQTDVNISVGGVLKPGVYGRVEVGTRPPPPVIYPQPVIITQPVVVVSQPVLVQRQPIYMHVPPGHAKKWDKHCYKYNACGQPVYFVRNEYSSGYEDGHGKHKNKHKKNKHDD